MPVKRAEEWELPTQNYSTSAVFGMFKNQRTPWVERRLSNPLAAAHAELCVNADAVQIAVSHGTDQWLFSPRAVLVYRSERAHK